MTSPEGLNLHKFNCDEKIFQRLKFSSKESGKINLFQLHKYPSHKALTQKHAILNVVLKFSRWVLLSNTFLWRCIFFFHILPKRIGSVSSFATIYDLLTALPGFKLKGFFILKGKSFSICFLDSSLYGWLSVYGVLTGINWKAVTKVKVIKKRVKHLQNLSISQGRSLLTTFSSSVMKQPKWDAEMNATKPCKQLC